jgi:hypothetical protein
MSLKYVIVVKLFRSKSIFHTKKTAQCRREEADLSALPETTLNDTFTGITRATITRGSAMFIPSINTNDKRIQLSKNEKNN